MPPGVWASVFTKQGVPVRFLGDVFYTDGDEAAEPARVGIVAVGWA